MAHEILRLLIADDNDSDRLILKTILEKQGHRVFSAKDGAEALKLFGQEFPDLVLLDALMPVMDGFQAAKAIKSRAGQDLIPVIFITSLKDAASLADCLHAGGDDFISKPYNRIVLHAKIQAHARMRRLHAEVQEQRDKIAHHSEHLIREQEVAKSVYDKIAHHGFIEAANIKSLLSPMAVFNGDMLLVAQKPSDGMYVLLGDFTGHGLPAAIGAMPASEIFYGMVKKGFAMEEILREINRKLKQILPVGIFCCAGMVDLSFHENVAKIWLGGLPDLIIYRNQSKAVDHVVSKHLPLGVLSDDQFRSSVELVSVEKQDKIYLWSDGIHEAVNEQGEMFGSNQLSLVFQNNQNANALFEDIIYQVKEFTGGSDQDDDHTMVEITVVDESDIAEAASPKEEQLAESNTVMDCSIICELRPDSLRTFNPLPLITHFLREVPGLKNHSGKLYTIIAELYSNALEHGLLGLSSELKQSVAGFADYYRKRTEALEALTEGQVTIKLVTTPNELKGGCLEIFVQDTGPGFDYSHLDKNSHLDTTVADHLLQNETYSGRGIPLIQTMCESLEYSGVGNAVKVTYLWD